MKFSLWCAAGIVAAAGWQNAVAQAGAAPTPTIQVTSKLVFLDVTVLDKKSHPVVEGLTKDDFVITEDKAPQRIFSFEAPDAHRLAAGASVDNPDGKAPLTILVLDQLNSNFPDFAYIRWEVKRYLESQPKELNSPTEMMVIGNQSLELVQNYTRDRGELLNALAHVPAAIPYKMMNGSFWAERLGQSFDALQQIALENKGVPGRKNIIWVGHGSPGLNSLFLPADVAEGVQRYAQDTTNMLVDARMTLFVIYPGLNVNVRGSLRMGAELDASASIGDDGPFATTGDINFGVFVDETGGKLFYNRNDVDEEMRQSERMGSEYYTLTYQPHSGDDNGRFRRIRVTVRDPNLRVVTKAGYYAPDKKRPVDPRTQLMQSIAEAARSTIPFGALHVTISDLVRHPDTQTAQFTARIPPKDLNWMPGDPGRSSTYVVIAAASLTDDRAVLTSRVQQMSVTVNTQALTQPKPGETVAVPLTLRIPKKAKSVRVVMESETGGRIGTAEVSRKAIDAAPAEPTPQPKLVNQPPQGNAGAPAQTPPAPH
jgi:VWFA-related protein